MSSESLEKACQWELWSDLASAWVSEWVWARSPIKMTVIEIWEGVASFLLASQFSFLNLLSLLRLWLLSRSPVDCEQFYCQKTHNVRTVKLSHSNRWPWAGSGLPPITPLVSGCCLEARCFTYMKIRYMHTYIFHLLSFHLFLLFALLTRCHVYFLSYAPA